MGGAAVEGWQESAKIAPPDLMLKAPFICWKQTVGFQPWLLYDEKVQVIVKVKILFFVSSVTKLECEI